MWWYAKRVNYEYHASVKSQTRHMIQHDAYMKKKRAHEEALRAAAAARAGRPISKFTGEAKVDPLFEV